MALTRRDFMCTIAAAAAWPPARRQTLQALVLGNVQDGGLPQAGCYTPTCDRGRTTPHYVASLALIDPSHERFYLVDATPDLTRQIDLIEDPAFRSRAAARRPFDGIFLTHAHIGHYLGLALLGREGLGMDRTPVYCTPAMAAYLSTNGPWSLLVDEGRVFFPPVAIDTWTRIDDTFDVKLILVPHRPEFADTVGFLFRGPRHTMLYLPDIDSWDAWDRRVEDVVRQVDIALLDATFYSPAEVPGRDVSEIPHPMVPDSMDRLQPAVDAGRRVVFTHLNNSNPLLDPNARERLNVRARGFEIAYAGMRFTL